MPFPDAVRRQRERAVRIEKLLQLARDQQGTPEGETAARIAGRLMRDSARHRKQTLRAEPTICERVIELGAKWPWRRRLAASVARHCACVAAWPKTGSKVALFGAVGTVDIAEYLLTVLLREIDQARADWLEEQVDWDPLLPMSPELARRCTGFCGSAVGAVEARLSELRTLERGEDPTGTALVHDEAAAVRRWMKDRGIELSKGAPSPYAFSPEGWRHGHGIALRDAVRAQPIDPTRRIRSPRHRR